MAKPSEHDYRYLLDGANDLHRAVDDKRVKEALQIACSLFTRLERDLAPNARLRRAIEDAHHTLQDTSRDAIALAVEVFETVELTAFRKAGATPAVVDAMTEHARWVRVHVERPNLDVEEVRRKVRDLRDAACHGVEHLDREAELDALLKKSKEASLGGAALYVDTAADLLGGMGLISVLSITGGIGMIGKALGVPGLKWPGKSGGESG
jgi:hypothetical protein